MTWTSLLLVSLGGALGTAGRFGLVVAVNRLSAWQYPFGTLLVNIAGSFLMGLLATMFARSTLLSATSRLVVTTGFLGGFTTYSAFSFEVVQMAVDGRYGMAATHAGAMILACFVATALGVWAGRCLVLFVPSA